MNSENFADFSTKFGEPTNEPFGVPPGQSHNQCVDGDAPPRSGMQTVMSPTVPVPRPQVVHHFSIR